MRKIVEDLNEVENCFMIFHNECSRAKAMLISNAAGLEMNVKRKTQRLLRGEKRGDFKPEPFLASMCAKLSTPVGPVCVEKERAMQKVFLTHVFLLGCYYMSGYGLGQET